MKYFFPDSQDFVDPSFDFVREVRSKTRVRQRDDLYAHEYFATPPLDGLLLSKAIVDGGEGGPGKYTLAQRNRLLRQGARQFFRLDARAETRHLKVIGDCGAFTYINEEKPPYTSDEVIDFYEQCGFDFGVAIDHIILAYDASHDHPTLGIDSVPAEWARRQQLTLEMAADFKRRIAARRCPFVPIGVAQGWSPRSYAHAVQELQRMGYDYIAIGGIVPLKTPEILACLSGIDAVREDSTKLHLLGVTRTEQVSRFLGHGVASFDSTAPLQRAFKDNKVNYFTPDGGYFTAIRVPQVEGNMALGRAIKSGRVNQDDAIRREQRCLHLLMEFDRGAAGLEETLDALAAYGELHDSEDRTAVYRQTLEARPWKQCGCEVCTQLGIHVVLFRGAERNRRRGFHNIYTFWRTFHAQLAASKAGKTNKRKGKVHEAC